MVEIRHVHAHQDDKIAFQFLKTEAKLNVLMDDFAKTASSRSSIQHRMIIPHLPRQKVSLCTPFERITRDVDDKIIRMKYGHEAEKYLKKKWNLGDNAMKKVLWSDIRKVIRSETL